MNHPRDKRAKMIKGQNDNRRCLLEQRKKEKKWRRLKEQISNQKQRLCTTKKPSNSATPFNGQRYFLLLQRFLSASPSKDRFPRIWKSQGFFYEITQIVDLWNLENNCEIYARHLCYT